MELDDALAFIVTELIEGKNLREDVRINGRYVAMIWSDCPASSSQQ